MEFVNNFVLFFQKDTYAVVVSVLGVIVSVFALWKTKEYSRKNLENELLDIEVELSRIRIAALSLPKKEQQEIIKEVEKIELRLKSAYKNKLNVDIEEKRNKELGFIDQDFLLYAVPAIIALSFTFAIVYLLISNQSIANYQTPEILKTGITTIIGYYFGVAVNNKPRAPKSSIEDIKKQLDSLL
jgi:hypothetical protein